MRSDRLREELARLYPEAVKDGQIDLARFRDREAASRGLGDWIWQKVSVLRLDRDAITDLALDQAKKRALDWLGEKLAAEIKDLRPLRLDARCQADRQNRSPLTHALEPEKMVPPYVLKINYASRRNHRRLP